MSKEKNKYEKIAFCLMAALMLTGAQAQQKELSIKAETVGGHGEGRKRPCAEASAAAGRQDLPELGDGSRSLTSPTNYF